MSTNTSTAASDTATHPNVDETEDNPADTDELESDGTAKPTSEQEAGSGITTERQMAFGEDGELEYKESNIDTTLDQFDFEIDPQRTESRIDSPAATSLMNDDRPDEERGSGGEQANLFPDVDEGQQTLMGSSAHNQCLFDTSEN